MKASRRFFFFGMVFLICFLCERATAFCCVSAVEGHAPHTDFVCVGSTDRTTAEPYTVRFETFGGTAVSQQLVEHGAAAKYPEPDPEKTGYHFTGWYTNLSFETAYSFGPVTNNTTVYARWVPATYTIRYSGEGVAAGTKQTYTIESSDATLPAPQRDGFIFAGWRVMEPGGCWEQDVLIGAETPLAGRYGNAALEAAWRSGGTEPEERTLRLEPNGGVLDGPDVSGSYVANDRVALPSAVRNGFTFHCWSDGENTYPARSEYTMPDKNVVLTAQWIENPTSFTLTYETNGGGSIAPETVVPGTTVQLDKALFRDGHTFLGWFADAGLTAQVVSITVTKDQTVYAGWRETAVPNVLNGTVHIQYVQGYSNGRIGPDDNVTRAEAATMIYRLLTAERRDAILTDKNQFRDLPKHLWYNKAVSSMAKGAYISGRTDGTFDGDAQITRAEFVTILARMVEPQNVGFRFSDVPVGHWAYPSVSTAASVGWVAGMPDGTFQPTKPITRAEAMTILNRVLHRGVGSSSVLGNYTVFPDNLNSSAWYYYEVIEASNSHEYTGARPNETWTSNAVEYEYDIAKYERPEP